MIDSVKVILRCYFITFCDLICFKICLATWQIFLEDSSIQEVPQNDKIQSTAMYQLLAFHLKCKDKWNTIPSLNIFKHNKYKYIGIMVCGGNTQLWYLEGSGSGIKLSKNLSDKGENRISKKASTTYTAFRQTCLKYAVSFLGYVCVLPMIEEL